MVVFFSVSDPLIDHGDSRAGDGIPVPRGFVASRLALDRVQTCALSKLMSASIQRPVVAAVAGRVAVGYAMLANLAAGLTVALRGSAPWRHPEPWWTLSDRAALFFSALAGLGLALAVVPLTRFTVRRFAWARCLHLQLRPMAKGLSLGHVLLIAVFSSLGEELLFRGLIQPYVGVLPASVLFGFLHQVPGQGRWVWMTWALVVGALFGIIFAATGSLVGPILAHGLINAVNLLFLRDHDPLASS